MKRYEFSIHTFGCKVNVYDTGLLQARLEGAGGRMASAEAESPAAMSIPRVHILNTCAVTAEATREAKRAVRRIKAREPLATVVVTGCAAQVDGAELDALPGVDIVVANSHKGELEGILDRHFAGSLGERVFRGNIFRKEDVEPGGGVEAGHTRAFLKIQDGCNSFCSYCVIPFARGKSRSVPIAGLARRARELYGDGAREIVLTGVHIGDYEDSGSPRRPNGRRLEDLVEAILEQTKFDRVRLTSLEPGELTGGLLSLYRSTDRLCRHFHMSVQAAQDRVLAAMRRAYGAAEVELALGAIQASVPGSFVGMDVIAGFPGETDEEFAEGFERLAGLPWTRIHAFPYSERPGTKAALAAGAVPRAARARRAQRLRELSLERYRAAADSQVGQIKQTLLIRARAGGGAQGLTRDYWPVRVAGAGEGLMRRLGQEIDIEIVGFAQDATTRMEGCLLGRAAKELVENPTRQKNAEVTKGERE